MRFSKSWGCLPCRENLEVIPGDCVTRRWRHARANPATQPPISHLARALGDEFGSGMCVANLGNFRQFHLTFPDAGKHYALRSELNWTHWR